MFRKMTSADVPEAYQITLKTREGSYTREGMTAVGITEESVIAMLDVAKTHQGWVCEEDGLLAGFAMGNTATGELWVLAVFPEYERKGIGSKLAASTEQLLISSGHNELWLAVIKDLQVTGYQFFKNRGWTDAEDRGPFRIMKKV